METYIGSNTAQGPDEAKLYWGRINGRDKIEVELTLDDVRRMYAEYVEWFNNEWRHTGQGMDGKTPKQVYEETRGPQKEIPEEMRKYIFTRREKRTVQRNRVTIDGIEYFNPQMVQYIGSEVEVRRAITIAQDEADIAVIERVRSFVQMASVSSERNPFFAKFNSELVERRIPMLNGHGPFF